VSDETVMDKVVVRVALKTDKPAIQELTTRAFGQEDEARIIQRIETDGDAQLQLVAEMGGRIVGHVMFYSIGVREKLGAAGLGPMSVDPWVQRERIGTMLVNAGLTMMRDGGAPIVFVLGHDWFYPRFGFNAQATEPFTSIYKGPHFFGLRFRHGPPMSGDLIFPRAFGP
jgi:putative acetyltransferase